MLVLCHGVFDVFHIGHLKYLEAARALGDRLIVTITADEFINKGAGRPLFNHGYRAEMLRSLRMVDECHVIYEPTAVSAILWYRPDIYAKGMDRRVSDVRLEKERAAVESYGGKLVIVKTEVQCSSGKIMTGKMLEEKLASQMKDSAPLRTRSTLSTLTLPALRKS